MVKNPRILSDQPELLVGRLQGGEMLGAEVGVQVAGLDPREFGQVINNL